MKSLRITQSILIVLNVIWLLPQSADGLEQPIVDQAVSSAKIRHDLITEYEKSPERVRDDRLLAVAISYAVESKIPKARPIYEQFLKDHPNHPRALRGLGADYLVEQRYDQAIAYLRKAWSLGDLDSLSMLAAAYVKSGRYAQMEDLIPSLLQHSGGDAEIVNWLIAYAIFYQNPPDVKLVCCHRDLFTIEAAETPLILLNPL